MKLLQFDPMALRAVPAVVALGLGISALTASAAHIDFALDGVFSSSSNLGDVGEVSGDPLNILGGVRSYETVNESFDGTVTTSLAAGGPLSLMDADGAQGRYWFGYGNESTAGDLNADFVGAEDWNSIAFSVNNVTGSGSLNLFVNSGPDTYFFNDQTVNASGEYIFFYNEVLDAIPSFDFASVDGVNFEVSSLEANSSFEISSVVRATNVVPEPATGLLVVFGTWFGLLARRRRD